MEAEPFFFFKDKIKFALLDVIAFANQGNLVINKTSCEKTQFNNSEIKQTNQNL